MEKLLWYLLAGTRGGYNRCRILESLMERPSNAHQLSEALSIDYRTVRHHLNVLTQHTVLNQPQGKAYGAPYFVSVHFYDNLATFERIRLSWDTKRGQILAKRDNASPA